LARRLPFDAFVQELEHRQGAFVGNQARWLYDDDNLQLVSFIGKVENLTSDMEQLSEKLQLKRRGFASAVNVSRQRSRDYRPYYSPAAVDTVSRIMENDCRLLGYQFE